MFALGTNLWYVCNGYGGDKQAAPYIKKALLADSALGLIYGVLAVLGFCGVLPMAVGITFCVIGVLHLALMGFEKVCIIDRNADP